MKTSERTVILLTCLQLCFLSLTAQKVEIKSEAVVGIPGVGNSLLTFNTERPWTFRQIDAGPSAGLELFSTVGLKNFIISTTGNVGIEVPAPTEKLHVNGSIKAIGPRISFGSAEYIADGGGFIIECNGALISTTDGADDLGKSANRWRTLYASNGVINTSDARLKSNIQNISYGLNEIMKLRPVSFEWKGQREYGTKLGLVAQEVQTVISEVVVDHEFLRDEQSANLKKVATASLGMYYADLIPVMIKAIQEQQQLLIEKDTLLISLQNKINTMETRLIKLEQLMQR